MLPLLDFSEKLSITNTTYNSTTPTYKLTASNDEYILLEEFSVASDSTFKTSGYIQTKINGSNFTTKGNQGTEVQLVNDFSVPFKEKSFVYIEPNSSLEVQARVSSGTGSFQVMVVGTRLKPYEFEALRKKYYGGAI